jgi:hypothetical protein
VQSSGLATLSRFEEQSVGEGGTAKRIGDPLQREPCLMPQPFQKVTAGREAESVRPDEHPEEHLPDREGNRNPTTRISANSEDRTVIVIAIRTGKTPILKGQC